MSIHNLIMKTMTDYFVYPEDYYDITRPGSYHNVSNLRHRIDHSPLVFLPCFATKSDNYHKLFDGINTSEQKVSKIDFSIHKNFYFHPGCKVPRYKVAELFKKHNAKTVRDPKKADLMITHDEAVKNYVDSNILSLRSEVVDKELLRAYISAAKDTTDTSELVALIDSPDTRFWSVASFETYANRLIHNQGTYFNYSDIRYDNVILKADVKEKLNDFISQNMVDERVLSSLLGESEIDEEMCKGIEDLLKSNSHSDIAMAIQVMMNSSFEKSYFYLMYFVHTYYKKLHWVKESNTVGFKSLKEYLGFSKSTLHKKNSLQHIDHIIKAALNNGMYDDTFMKKIFRVYDAQFDYNNSDYVRPLTFEILKKS